MRFWTLGACLILSALIIFASSFARTWPHLDLLALVQTPAIFIGLLASGGLALLVRNLPFRVAALVFAVALLSEAELPGVRPSGPCQPHSETVTLGWLNAYGAPNEQAIIDWIKQARPQIVGFAELGTRARRVRRYLASVYPYKQSCLPDMRCSTLLYSRLKPIESKALARGDPENRKTLSSAALTIPGPTGGSSLTVAALHLSRPTSPRTQEVELHQLETRLDLSADTILIGDFNLSPRMLRLRDFALRNGLEVTLNDVPTWPMIWKGSELPGFWQIDHLLLARNWKASAMRGITHLGSDHRGYIATACRTRPE